MTTRFDGLEEALLGFDAREMFPRSTDRFDDAHRALAFKETTDARVPEHAPFFVYALRAAPAQTCAVAGVYPARRLSRYTCASTVATALYVSFGTKPPTRTRL